MHRFVLEQMGDFARAGEAIEGPSHFRSWPISEAAAVDLGGGFLG
jgi:hypothetical protein